MPRTPNTASLIRAVAGAIASDSKPRTALTYLQANREVYAGYGSIEDVIWDLDEPGGERLKGVVHHLTVLRATIAQVLWAAEIFVGVSVLDDLLFAFIRDPACLDPTRAVLEFIRERGLHRPGFVVYPIHGLGLHGFGFLSVVAKARASLLLGGANAVVVPQANSFARACANIADAGAALDVSATVPRDLLQHWHESRSLEWLHANPLVVYSMRNRPGSYYENQAFVLLKLRYLSTLLFMLTVLEDHGTDRVAAAFSTSRVNNFETMDLRHYLVFYPDASKRRVLTGDCVPMGRRRASTVEATDVPVEISPKLWRRRSTLRDRVETLVQEMERRYLRYYLLPGEGSVRARVARKVYDSFHYFRRSFRVDSYPGEHAVALATAFEVLLTDNYSRGVDATIQAHLALALRGVRGNRPMRAAVAQLYTARSEVVHGGRTSIQIDFGQAKLAYVHAALRLSELWPTLPDNAADPIAQVLRRR